MPLTLPTMPRDGLRIGTFVKTASPQVVEILGLSRLDFAVIDAEHAPFDRTTLDLMMMASCAVGLPLAVRIPEVRPATVLSTLDIGAAGLLVPHVDTPAIARDVVAMTRHRGGVRGFSGSPRFARYGTLSMTQSLDAGAGAFVMCQIESAEAVENAAAIAAVDGVDGLFIGYADLALSMGLESPQAPAVTEAAEKVIAIGRAAGKTVGMFVANAAERDRFAARGVEWIVLGSDQSLLRQAADALVPTS
ncbi:HpcH/HpaI aldolase family protein [Rhodoplanes serenus]|uniref:HpcH/HpaI aldolase family protein n=1 Tax=Rhodoplanes serenus TaxID=200615 RepID=UPI001AECE12D|nr:aldolase/citrate lyase family protein [Rhodoplanes serenus]